MKLYYNTISPLLKQVLLDLMKAAEFNEFRLRLNFRSAGKFPDSIISQAK